MVVRIPYHYFASYCYQYLGSVQIPAHAQAAVAAFCDDYHSLCTSKVIDPVPSVRELARTMPGVSFISVAVHFAEFAFGYELSAPLDMATLSSITPPYLREGFLKYLSGEGFPLFELIAREAKSILAAFTEIKYWPLSGRSLGLREGLEKLLTGIITDSPAVLMFENSRYETFDLLENVFVNEIDSSVYGPLAAAKNPIQRIKAKRAVDAYMTQFESSLLEKALSVTESSTLEERCFRAYFLSRQHSYDIALSDRETISFNVRTAEFESPELIRIMRIVAICRYLQEEGFYTYGQPEHAAFSDCLEAVNGDVEHAVFLNASYLFMRCSAFVSSGSYLCAFGDLRARIAQQVCLPPEDDVPEMSASTDADSEYDFSTGRALVPEPSLEPSLMPEPPRVVLIENAVAEPVEAPRQKPFVFDFSGMPKSKPFYPTWVKLQMFHEYLKNAESASEPLLSPLQLEAGERLDEFIEEEDAEFLALTRAYESSEAFEDFKEAHAFFRYGSIDQKFYEKNSITRLIRGCFITYTADAVPKTPVSKTPVPELVFEAPAPAYTGPTTCWGTPVVVSKALGA